VIANNVLRNCGRGIWVYSSDALIAHNVLDGCGEGITVTGYARTCNYNQAIDEPGKPALMAVRNNLVVNNMLIDCPGSYVGITPDDGFGAGNYSDYNAFVWTLPVYHRTGNHISFLEGWNSLYARLPEWRYQRHYDTHSVVSDPGLLKEENAGSPWIAMAPSDVVGDPLFVARQLGDYRLRPDSPLHGRGIGLPRVLNSAYVPGSGTQIVSRQWAKTLRSDAPDPTTAKSVYGGEDGHYRLQPLPRLQRLAELDSQSPGTPGLNPVWSLTGDYPVFDSSRPADTAEDNEWQVYPENRLQDPSFTKPLAGPEKAGGPWIARGGMHMAGGMACANLLTGQTDGVLALQRVGKVAAGCEYILFGDMTVSSASPQFSSTGALQLAVGDDLQPVGTQATVTAEPGKAKSWNTCEAHYRSGAAEQDPNVAKDLYVVLRASTQGPADVKTETPVAFVRWDNLTLLTGER